MGPQVGHLPGVREGGQQLGGIGIGSPGWGEGQLLVPLVQGGWGGCWGGGLYCWGEKVSKNLLFMDGLNLIW